MSGFCRSGHIYGNALYNSIENVYVIMVGVNKMILVSSRFRIEF